MNYHIGRLVLSSLCVGAFVAAGIWWCSFCRLQPARYTLGARYLSKNTVFIIFHFFKTAKYAKNEEVFIFSV